MNTISDSRRFYITLRYSTMCGDPDQVISFSVACAKKRVKKEEINDTRDSDDSGYDARRTANDTFVADRWRVYLPEDEDGIRRGRHLGLKARDDA
jgi:hypothetical protein